MPRAPHGTRGFVVAANNRVTAPGRIGGDGSTPHSRLTDEAPRCRVPNRRRRVGAREFPRTVVWCADATVVPVVWTVPPTIAECHAGPLVGRCFD